MGSRAIKREPGRVVGAEGLTGSLDLSYTGICALPPQLFTQKKLSGLGLGSNPHSRQASVR
jgi:hypothetical protein